MGLEEDKLSELEIEPEISGDHNSSLGVITRMISKLRGDVHDSSGNTTVKGNLENPEITRAVDQELLSLHPQLIEDVKSGKKHARLYAGLGVLTIFVAAAGVELIFRHGKDLKTFMEKREKEKQE